MKVEEIKRNLKGDLGKEILFYETTGSTNAVALDLAEHSREGLVIISDRQEKGRGRLGRSWSSPPGVNVYMSIILKPDVDPADATLITLLTAVACSIAIRNAVALDVKIKWPNDLIVSGKKVGGILTELKIHQKKVDFAVVGIGINVNAEMESFPEDIRKIATSFKNETGKTYSRESVVSEILNEMNRWYLIFRKSDREAILSSWKKLTSTLGREVVVVTGRETYKGFAESIDDRGALLLRLPSGETRIVNSGDLRILR